MFMKVFSLILIVAHDDTLKILSVRFHGFICSVLFNLKCFNFENTSVCPIYVVQQR